MGKEIEFKVPMSRKQAENVIAKMIKDREDSKLVCLTSTKLDSYWKERGNDSSDNIPTIRVRSNLWIGNNDIKHLFGVSGNQYSATDLVKLWFFNVTCPELGPLANACRRKDYVTLKRKQVTNGVEVNDEFEERISREAARIIVLSYNELGYNYFNKMKRCCSIHNYPMSSELKGKINIDVDNVNDKYYFEIEFVSADGITYDEKLVLPVLAKVAKEYNIDLDKRDPRSWIEIVSDIETPPKAN